MAVPPEATRSLPLRWVRPWTRKLHFFVGLYFLLFTWLFSVSGLLLNHTWRSLAAEFETSEGERAVREPEATEDVAIARDLMLQLGISGEIQQTERSPTGDRFLLQVLRPDRLYRVTADFPAGRAKVEDRTTNAWGLLRGFHTFSGVSLTERDRVRDAAVTKVWSVSMDALAVGLVFLVFSGLYMWLPLTPKRRWGLIALGLGTLSSAWFVFGLAAIF